MTRTQLDKRLKRERLHHYPRPRDGWIRTLRQALGMTAVQLAKRLGISKQAISNFERAERDESITIKSLKKIAAALGCELKIVFVPHQSLEKTLQQRALKLAQDTIARSNLYMDLENQGTSKQFQKKQIKKIADDLLNSSPRKIWEEL